MAQLAEHQILSIVWHPDGYYVFTCSCGNAATSQYWNKNPLDSPCYGG